MDNKIVIEIDGEDIGFQFTMLTLEMICEREGINYYQLLDHATNKPLGVVNSLMACGHAKYENAEAVDKNTADDWLSSIDGDNLQRLWNCFEESLISILQKMESMRDKNDNSESKKK